jgi:uncharacterized membrane protein YccC
MSQITASLGTETFANGQDFLDRLTAIGAKLNDLEAQSRRPPADPQLLGQWLALLANELSRARQFTWKLLQDVRDQASRSAASKPPTDA